MDANRIKTTSGTRDSGTTDEKRGGRTTTGTADGGPRHHRHDGETTEQTSASEGEVSATGHRFVAAGGAKLSETETSENDAKYLSLTSATVFLDSIQRAPTLRKSMPARLDALADRGRAVCNYSSIGSTTETVVPSPGSESTYMSPSWRSTILLVSGWQTRDWL